MPKNVKRIYWVDAAKFIGIFLVIYAHIVGEIRQHQNPIAFNQFKFICSFNMPFFFFLAGFFFKRKHQSAEEEIKVLFLKRIIPVFFFSIATIPFRIAYQYFNTGHVQYRELTKSLLHYLHGDTRLNHVMWFLVCLFTTEVFAIILLPKITKIYQKILIAILSMSLGLILTNEYKIFEPYFGIYKNTWYIHEALVGLGFYITGHLAFPQLHKLLQMKAVPRLTLAVLFSTLTILTFDMNRPYEAFLVIMKLSFHGSSLYFLTTAILGSLATVFIATFIPKSQAIAYLGKNTLILLGINGFFHHFVNRYLPNLFTNLDSALWVTGYSMLTSILSLLLSVPVIYVLNQYFPQLVGRPYQKGPILPSLRST